MLGLGFIPIPEDDGRDNRPGSRGVTRLINDDIVGEEAGGPSAIEIHGVLALERDHHVCELRHGESV